MIVNEHDQLGQAGDGASVAPDAPFVMPEGPGLPGDTGIGAATYDHAAGGAGSGSPGADFSGRQAAAPGHGAETAGNGLADADILAQSLKSIGGTLKIKLVGSLVLLTVIVLILGGVSLKSLLEINGISHGIASRHAKLAQINEDIKTTVLRVSDKAKDFLLLEDTEALERSELLMVRLRDQLKTAVDISDAIERESGVRFGDQYRSLAEAAEQYGLQFSQQSTGIRDARQETSRNVAASQLLRDRLMGELNVIRAKIKTLVDDYWIEVKRRRVSAATDGRPAIDAPDTLATLPVGIDITNLDRELLNTQVTVARYLETEEDNYANAVDLLINDALDRAEKISLASRDGKIALTLDEAHKALNLYKGLFQDARDSIGRISAKRTLIESQVEKQKADLRQTGESLLAQATAISNRTWDAIIGESIRLNDAAASAWIVLLIAAVAGTITGFAVLYFVPRPILATIKELLRGTQLVAAGDLTYTIPVTSNDELGQLAVTFNHMRASLLSLVQRIQRASVQIATTVNEIQAASSQQAMTARQQLGSLNEFGVALREIAQTSKRLADTAESMASDAHDVAEMVHQNNIKSSQTLGSMEAIDTATKQTSDRIKALNDQMDSINDAVSTISGVADVTTLLSLNAAIEANKAGEMGKGFSVVASEIRRLSDRSIDSAEAIAGIVRDIQRAAESSVVSMDKSAGEIRMGASLVRETTNNLDVINQRMDTIRGETTNLAEGAGEQAEACGGAQSAVGDLQSSANLSAQAARQTSLASHELSEMAAQLTTAVSAFRI